MTIVRNGVGEPLAGWVIAQVHGLTLIGKCSGKVGDHGVLSPVYELKQQLVPQPNGSVAVARMAFPVWLLTVDGLELPAGALLHPCSALGRAEQKDLERAIRQADEFYQAAKAAAAGLTVARQMPKVQT